MLCQIQDILYIFWFLGANITLKDGKWALAVEKCLNSVITSFCVNDYHDEKVLEQIFSQVCRNGQRPSTITSRFQVTGKLMYYFNTLDGRSLSTDFAQKKNFPTAPMSVDSQHGMSTPAPEVGRPTARYINARRQKSVDRLCFLMHTGTGMLES